MSRYLLLLLLNLPFIIIATISAITKYKIGHSSKGRLVTQLIIWFFMLIGLVSAHSVYQYLFDHQLTESEPLSLFDVVQITAIVLLFYLVNRMQSRVEYLENRLSVLHKELSITLSTSKSDDK